MGWAALVHPWWTQLPRPDRVLLGWLALDLVLIVLHIIHKVEHYYWRSGHWWLAQPGLALEVDGGLAELYQYGKELAIIGLLINLAWRQQWLFGVWFGLFCYLCADDVLQVHERLGALINQTVQVQPYWGIAQVDWAQLLVSASVGSGFLLAILLAYAWGDASFRAFCRSFGLIVCLLSVFGVGIDMIHVAQSWLLTRGFLTIVEDGGELLVMSLALWFVWQVQSAQRANFHLQSRSSAPLRQFFEKGLTS